MLNIKLEPTIGLNFIGTTGDGGPPDTMGAVGPNHIVELNNPEYRVFDKDTGSQVKFATSKEFWEDAGVVSVQSPFDPRILYDPFSERWFATGISRSDPPTVLVGVSKDADPTLGWTGFEIGSFPVADFPTLGFNSDAVFISFLEDFIFPFNNPVIVLPKEDLINGNILSKTIFEEVRPDILFQPIVDLDNTGQPYPLYREDSGRFITRIVVDGPINSPTIDLDAGSIPVKEFPGTGALEGAKQPDTDITLDYIDSRFGSNLVRKNGAIWGVNHVANNDRSAIRWFQIDADTNKLLQEGLIFDPKLDFFYGSIAVNDYDDVVIGFNGSGEKQFVSSLAVVGDTFDDRTIFSEPIFLKESTVSFEKGNRGIVGDLRWGDYSATVVDPEDPFTFWTFQELALSKSEWSTQITEINLAPEAEPTPNLLFSLRSSQKVNGTKFKNEDIIQFDGTNFSLYFDGSDVGLSRAAINAFDAISDDEILISFKESTHIRGLGRVKSQDVVKFKAKSLGHRTRGTFSLYFDGSDVGLTRHSENIDAITGLPDGKLLISTKGNLHTRGHRAHNEDISLFESTSLGKRTRGKFSTFFDGSDVGLRRNNVNAFSIDETDDLFFSTEKNFKVEGLSGTDLDVFDFTPTSLGHRTRGTFASELFFEGSEFGLRRNDVVGADVSFTPLKSLIV